MLGQPIEVQPPGQQGQHRRPDRARRACPRRSRLRARPLDCCGSSWSGGRAADGRLGAGLSRRLGAAYGRVPTAPSAANRIPGEGERRERWSGRSSSGSRRCHLRPLPLVFQRDPAALRRRHGARLSPRPVADWFERQGFSRLAATLTILVLSHLRARAAIVILLPSWSTSSPRSSARAGLRREAAAACRLAPQQQGWRSSSASMRRRCGPRSASLHEPGRRLAHAGLQLDLERRPRGPQRPLALRRHAGRRLLPALRLGSDDRPDRQPGCRATMPTRSAGSPRDIDRSDRRLSCAARAWSACCSGRSTPSG